MSESPSPGSVVEVRRFRRQWTVALLAAGLGAAVAGVSLLLFRAIALVTNLAYFGRWSLADATPGAPGAQGWSFLVPAAGGLLVGLIAKYGSPQVGGHGIDAVMESVLFRRSRVQPRLVLLKPLSSAIVIGTGGPFGVEGPIIQTGGAVGSAVGQMFSLTAGERKALLAAGAAAGLAAAFGTPLAAVLLAVELILFEYKARSLIPVTLAVAAAMLLRGLLPPAGAEITFAAIDFRFGSQVAWYGALGVVCGLAAVAFVKTLAWTEHMFFRLEHVRVPEFWWPMLGGLAVGLLGWFEPRVLGPGYGTIARLVNGGLSLPTVALLLLLKPAAVFVSLGSRTSGGTLAPMFLTGAALGVCFEALVRVIAPGAAPAPGACALLAMAAFFGAASRAPLALMLFGLEMSRQLGAVLPLMVAVITAYAVAVVLARESVMTQPLLRKGLPVASDFEADIFRRLRVADVMDRHPTLFPATITLAEVWAHVRSAASAGSRQGMILVRNGDQIAGILTRKDLERARAGSPDGAGPALTAGSEKPVVAFGDELLDDVVTRMFRHDVSRVPVVTRTQPARVVGYLGRREILNARLHRHWEEDHAEAGWLKTMLRSRPH